MILVDLLYTMLFPAEILIISCSMVLAFLPFQMKLRILKRFNPLSAFYPPFWVAEFFTESIPFFLAWGWGLYHWVFLLSETLPTLTFSLTLWGLLQILFEPLRPRLIPEELPT